jgi:hypothetical protein
MPKETKTETPPEEKPATVKVVRDDTWYSVRTVNTQAAIDALESDNKRLRAKTLLDEVINGVDEDGAVLDDKERLASYSNLKVLDGRWGMDSIKTVRSTDPKKQAYEDHALLQAENLLNIDADFTQFAAIRKTKTGSKLLSLASLRTYLAGKWEDNNPYNPATDYTLLNEAMVATDEEVEESEGETQD